MAERRMFAKSIVLSDAFLDMPLSSRCLYFTLGMLADDDGFVSSPKAIMRQCGATQDDLTLLLQKRYILGFASGVIVIKHWRMNNQLRSDRIHSTTYLEEKEQLMIDERGAYTEKHEFKGLSELCQPSDNQVTTNCQPSDNQTATEISIGKDSIGKYSIYPPISPQGESEYDFSKHTNTVNYSHIKETEPFGDDCLDYITCHTELDECVTTWMQYKDEKKTKANRYGETGMRSLLKKIYVQSLEHGIKAVIDCVELSMSGSYQGIVWDKLKAAKQGTGNVFDDWANA